MARSAFLPALFAVACYSLGAGAPEPAAAQRGTSKFALVASVHAASPAPESTSPARAQAQVGADSARCPKEMARVTRPQGAFCIDRWEASLEERFASGPSRAWPGNRLVSGHEAALFAVSVPKQRPQGYISGAEAARACANAGKRLCEIDEWVRTCRGPRGSTYPYGDTRKPEVCNDRSHTQTAHPVQALFDRFAKPGTDRKAMWETEWMNDPRLHELADSVEPAGARSGCRNEYGVYDLVGNLHEWVADPEGTFVGGFFMDTQQNGEGCGYRTRAHDFNYHDYSTGFRCCKDG
jgi:hypothetical protein